MTSSGIFGPKLSGKTTLAAHLSRQHWLREKRRSLVFDPHMDGDWGQQAWVTTNEDGFWKAVWKTKDSLIIIDEAAMTIKRNRELIPVFTALRHNGHKLIVIGHSGIDLLPTMRQQLDTIFLFRQSQKAALIWAEVFTEESLIQATSLKQYEFIQHKMYGLPQKCKLTLSGKT